jgi:hypothetical protein
MLLPDAEASAAGRRWLDALEHARADRRARRSRQLWRSIVLVPLSTSAIVVAIAAYEVGAQSHWFGALPA